MAAMDATPPASQKRGRSGEPEPSQPEEESSPSRIQLDALIDEIRQEMLGSIDTNFGNLRSEMANSTATTVANAIRRYDTQANVRFEKLETTTASISADQDKLAEKQAKLREDLEALKAAVDVAEKVQPLRNPDEMVVATAFNRDIDVTILQINCRVEFPRNHIRDAILPFMQEAGLAEADWSVTSFASPAKKFSVKFGGIPGQAERRVEKVLQVLRAGPDGKWRTVTARTAAGNTDNIFIGRDRNPAMVKREIATKNLATVIKDLFPTVTVFPNRAQGIISCGWKPIAKIEVHPEQAPTEIKWNVPALTGTVIDKDKVMEEFFKRERARASPPAVWSI